MIISYVLMTCLEMIAYIYTHEEKIESCCEDIYIVDEPLFLDELFKDECDYNSKMTRVEDFKSRVPLRKKT